MPDDTLFVPTDSVGTQFHDGHEIRWPLPDSGEPGAALAPAEAGGVPRHLLSLDELLDDLGERIFLAAGSPPRLLAETAWDLDSAARFALDCAEHAVFDADDLKLPSGTSLGDVIRAARHYLEDPAGDGETTGLLHRISRLAAARRLRKLGDEVADVAFEISLEDERADLEALDDGAFTAVASIRDAVLAVVETIRHAALSHLSERDEDRYEEDAAEPTSAPQVVTTPWGNVVVGMSRAGPPASLTAREAAERARAAVTEASGDEAGAQERSWQLARLSEALGAAPVLPS